MKLSAGFIALTVFRPAGYDQNSPQLPRSRKCSRPEPFGRRQSWTSGVPRSSMYLYVNAWFPSWFAGESPASDQSTLVDWITYSAQ